MVTYTVIYTVRHEAYGEYVEWLKNEHIPEMLTVPGFTDASLCLRKGGALEASSKDVRVVYHLKDEDHLKTYIAEHAMKIREKAMDKFPGQFSAQREVWMETFSFTSK